MINISNLNGQFPDTLKVAKLIPIHKSGTQDDHTNCRPISILSILSKIVEKHVTKHMYAYLNKYSLLHKSQSWFRTSFLQHCVKGIGSQRISLISEESGLRD